MLDPNDPETLVLGPFRGAPTEHVRIPVSQGICGAAVAQNDTVIVDDVHSESTLPGMLASDAIRDRRANSGEWKNCW